MLSVVFFVVFLFKLTYIDLSIGQSDLYMDNN